MLLTSGRQVVDVNLVLQNYCNVRTEWLLKVMGSFFAENALIHVHVLLTHIMQTEFEKHTSNGILTSEYMEGFTWISY